MELSTYFRINAADTGQFERTLIVAEEGAYVSYLEGCKALAWAPDGKTPVWAFVTNAQGKKEFVRGLHARRLT